jgi:lipoate-protein ligase A
LLLERAAHAAMRAREGRHERAAPAELCYVAMRWHLLITPPASGAENMALDDALLERARVTGTGVLRVYSWSSPTLSFGRNQTARGHYDPALARSRAIDVVRRPTGGRAVLHHREVTYSVTAPTALMGSLREAYGRINQILLHALHALGVPAAEANPVSRTPVPSASPCFEEPVRGELVLGSDGAVRKLVASAQWREGAALLQHGSILVDDDQALVSELSVPMVAGSTTPRRSWAPESAPGLVFSAPQPVRPATLRDALGRAPTAGEVADALVGAVVTLEDKGASHITVDGALRDSAHDRLARFMDDAWTWRR